MDANAFENRLAALETHVTTRVNTQLDDLWSLHSRVQAFEATLASLADHVATLSVPQAFAPRD